MKAIEKLHEISERLALCGIEAAGKEAEIFVKEGLDIDSVQLYRDDPEINDKQSADIEAMLSRRARREPLQYILGHCDFAGLKILVGQGILVPRPETELMAECAIKTVGADLCVCPEKYRHGIERTQRTADNRSQTTILDLCTGSGCLALSLARAFPHAHVFGTDISGTAVDYARKNAGLNGIDNAVFLEGYLFDPLEETQLFDLIISNPPYIKTGDIRGLQPEIRDWEPLTALDGGADGLVFYREIIPAAREHLKDNGTVMLELGAGCEDAVAGMLDDAGYREIEMKKDYAGIKRIIHAQWIR